jgi:hypothetical protein
MTIDHKHTTHCKNCGNHFEGKYCNVCGQKAIVTRIDWAFVWFSFQHGVFHLDKGFLFTIREFFIRPGYAARDYIGGKRVNYMPPLAYVVITSVLSILLVDILNTNGPIEYAHQLDKDFVNFVLHYNDKISLIILIPLSAMLTKAFFPRSHFNFFELFAFHCFIRGQFNVIAMFVVFLDWFLVQMEVYLATTTILVLSIVPNTLIMAFGLKQLMNGKNFWRYFLVSVAIMAAMALTGELLGVLAASIMFGNGQ